MRQHDHWTRLAWPLAILAAGLAATLGIDWRRHPSLARVEQWGDLPRWWAAGVALTFLAAGGVWLWRRRAGLRAVRRLDRRLDANNRLETAAVLRGDAGAMAQAQREEAAAFLARQRVAPPRRGPLLALGALAAVLVLAHLAALLSWTRPWVSLAAAAKPVPKPAPAALPAGAHPVEDARLGNQGVARRGSPPASPGLLRQRPARHGRWRCPSTDSRA